MKRFRNKKLLILCLALLAAVLLTNATRAPKPSLIEHSAVVSGGQAIIRVMPSPYTASMGVCFQGQRLTVWKPSIFSYYRARCSGIDGFVLRQQITITD